MNPFLASRMCRSRYRSITLRDVLSSKKSEPEETPQPQTANDRSKSGPTPSRKQAQARNDHSLIVADRKAAKKAARERARAMRLEQDRLQQEALITGDERYMPLRDKGKVKRFTRDWLDARWSFSEFVFPVMILFFVVFFGVSFFASTSAAGQRALFIVMVIMYALFFVAIVETSIVWQRIKRQLRKVYPREPMPRRMWFYAFSRAIMLRPWRSPRPQVERGQFPKR